MPVRNLSGEFSLSEKKNIPGGRDRSLVFTRSTNFWVSDLGWSPNTDIFETENDLIIRVEIAGVDKDRIDITLKGTTLSICGYRHDQRRSKQVHFHQAEINYGPFEKVIILPDSLQNKNIDAKYREGFLEIIISKHPQTDTCTINDIEIDG